MNQRPLRKRSLSIARFRAPRQRCTASCLRVLLSKAYQRSLTRSIATIRLIVDWKCECLVTATLPNRETPAGFLRWEGPIVLPRDPIDRVDLLSDEKSGSAESAG